MFRVVHDHARHGGIEVSFQHAVFAVCRWHPQQSHAMRYQCYLVHVYSVTPAQGLPVVATAACRQTEFLQIELCCHCGAL